MISFLYPIAFLLIFLPLLFKFFMPVAKKNLGNSLKVPFIKDLLEINKNSDALWGGFGSKAKKSFRLTLLFLIWVALVCAVARPQLVGEPIRIKANSRDVLMVMDISTSMLERDFSLGNQRVDRLTAVKNMATNFVKGRGDDKVGLVLFGTNAYLQAPISYDKNSVIDILWQMDAGMAGNSTAIGDALGLGLKYLKNSPNLDKKVMILLTDGENNDGFLTVVQAIKLAKEEGVKIYTIGVGSDNDFMSSMLGAVQGVDEKSLKEIAKETKGQYFRAKDSRALAQIYKEIDKLEPIETNANTVVKVQELFYVPLLFAVFLALFLAFFIRSKSYE